MHRTTILLDREAREAARELALRLECSTSEAIRRSIVRMRDLVAGVPPEQRRRRVMALERAFELGVEGEATGYGRPASDDQGS